MKLALRFITLFALIIALPLAKAADPTGTWKGSFDYQGNTVSLTFNLKIDGSKIIGTVEGLPTTPAEIHDGALAGDTVTFWVNTDYQGQTYKLVYKGKIAADQISFDFGTEDGSWSAPLTVKKAGAMDAAAPRPADVNGDWKGSLDVEGMPTELTLHLKSSGNTVTGTIDRAGSPPMEVHEGKIEGATLSFWINSEYEGETYTIVCKGKVTPGQIDLDLGTADESWSGSMTVKRASDTTPAAQTATAPPSH